MKPSFYFSANPLATQNLRSIKCLAQTRWPYFPGNWMLVLTLVFSCIVIWPGPIYAQQLDESLNGAAQVQTSLVASMGGVDSDADLGLLPFNSHSGDLTLEGAESIDTFTGTLRLHYTDIDWPGQGLPIKVERTYSGFQTIRKGVTNEFGNGWTINAMRLIPYSKKVYTKKHKHGKQQTFSFVLQMPDGQFKRFLKLDDRGSYSGEWRSSDNWRMIISDDDEQAQITAPNGMQYTLLRNILGKREGKEGTEEYALTHQEDLHGNTLDYEYERLRGANRLSRIVSSDGREVTFHYDRLHNKTILKKIHAGDQVWQYSFESGKLQHDNGKVPVLTKVTRPDGLSTRYHYHCYAAGCQVDVVYHPNGGKTTYRYKHYHNDEEIQILSAKAMYRLKEPGEESSRGSLLGYAKVAEWKFHIPDRSEYAKKCGQFHCYISTVIGPSSRIEYQHAVAGKRYDYMNDQGLAWSHGLLLKQTVYDNPEGTGDPIETQTITWDKQYFSHKPWVNDSYVFDTNSHRALMKAKQVMRDGTDYVTEYTDFDQYGQPGTITYRGLDGELTYHFHYGSDLNQWIIGFIREIDSPEIGRETFEYNDRGLLIHHDQYGVSTQYQYDESGQLTQKEDALGRVWQYADYHRGKPRMTVRSDGVVLHQDIDDYGRVVAKTDANGHVTQTGYDALGRATHIIPPIGAPTYITYNGDAGPGGVTVKHGDWITVTRQDTLGRKRWVKTIDAQQGEINTERYEYDADGRMAFHSLKYHSDAGDPTLGQYMQYDALNRVVASGIIQGNKALKTSRVRYLPNREVLITDPKGQVTKQRFRSIRLDENALMSSTDPNGIETQIQRNVHGDITEVQQGGFRHRFEYNPRYHLVRTHIPEAGVIHTERDPLGRVMSQAIGSEQPTHFHYDAMDNVTLVDYPDGNFVEKHYDLNGNVISVSNPNSQWDYQYNASNQIIQSILSVDNKALQMNYQYDDQGALSAMVYPNGHVVDYAPDALGRPTRVGDDITQIDYTPVGQTSAITYANGVREVIDYDRLKRPTRHQVQSSQNLYDVNYQYNALDFLTQIHDALDQHRSISMDYDPTGRLTVANGPWGNGEIHYDALGNITQKRMGEQTLAYHYDAHNRLQSISGSMDQVFNYDNHGNVTGDGQFTYHYNMANQLTGASGVAPLSIHYDGWHHRVYENNRDSKTLFMFDADHHLLFEQDGGGESKNHIYLAGKRIATHTEQATQYYHNNFLGSPVLATNRHGQLLWRAQYLPFGAHFGESHQDAWYTNKPNVQSMPLQDFAARYYHPSIGRFMSIDPVGFTPENLQSFNRYAYAFNNPYTFIDPDGEFGFAAFFTDFFDGFVFGISLGLGGREGEQEHAYNVGYYVGTAAGAAIAVTPAASGTRVIGLVTRLRKYRAESWLLKRNAKRKVWSEYKDYSPEESAIKKWSDHHKEFSELNNVKEYIEYAEKHFASRHKLMTRQRANGDIEVYDKYKVLYGVYTEEGVPKTFFRPRDGIKYWKRTGNR